MRIIVGLVSLLFACVLLNFQQAEAQDCLTLDEFSEPIVGETRTSNLSSGGTVTCSIEAFEVVPGLSVSAYRYACTSGWIAWLKLVGSQWVRYRECYPEGGGCITYTEEDPWVIYEFPLCEGNEYSQHPNWPSYTVKVESLVSEVTVPAGTFYDCVETNYYVDTTLRWIGIVCPCIGSVKEISFWTDPSGVTSELASYDICPDVDEDGYWDSSCLASRTCGGDCDDSNSAVNPGAVETCGNGIDENCVGGDEVCPLPCSGSVSASTMAEVPDHRYSDLVYHLGYLLLPLAALIGLMIWRRKK